MESRTRVVVYGSTLPMAGVAASLKTNQSLEVVCVDSHASTLRQSLGDLDPDTIVFDLSDPSASMDVTLLRHKTGVQLIGVDPGSDDILVLSGRPQQALSVAELVHVIQQK